MKASNKHKVLLKHGACVLLRLAMPSLAERKHCSWAETDPGLNVGILTEIFKYSLFSDDFC